MSINNENEAIKEKVDFFVQHMLHESTNLKQKDAERDIVVLYTFYQVRKRLQCMPINKDFVQEIMRITGWSQTTAYSKTACTAFSVLRYWERKYNDRTLRDKILNYRINRSVHILDYFYRNFMKFW